jgi:hypothetical protein
VKTEHNRYNAKIVFCLLTDPEANLKSPIKSWREYYEWRRLPLHSPVAILLHWVCFSFQQWFLFPEFNHRKIRYFNSATEVLFVFLVKLQALTVYHSIQLCQVQIPLSEAGNELHIHYLGIFFNMALLS